MLCNEAKEGLAEGYERTRNAAMTTEAGNRERGAAYRPAILGVNIDQKAVSQLGNDRRLVTDYEPVCFCKASDCTERELLQDFHDEKT